MLLIWGRHLAAVVSWWCHSWVSPSMSTTCGCTFLRAATKVAQRRQCLHTKRARRRLRGGSWLQMTYGVGGISCCHRAT
jgi:hypothetical protein